MQASLPNTCSRGGLYTSYTYQCRKFQEASFASICISIKVPKAPCPQDTSIMWATSAGPCRLRSLRTSRPIVNPRLQRRFSRNFVSELRNAQRSTRDARGRFPTSPMMVWVLSTMWWWHPVPANIPKPLRNQSGAVFSSVMMWLKWESGFSVSIDIFWMTQPIGLRLAVIVRHHQQWNFAKECSMHQLLLGPNRGKFGQRIWVTTKIFRRQTSRINCGSNEMGPIFFGGSNLMLRNVQ